MLAGPLFSREALTLPRQVKHYLVRSGYVAALFVLMYTAGQTTFGWQQVRNVSEIARFGELMFQVFAFVQLALTIFFSVLFAASNVAAEKDRRTMLLLLMTDLRDRELVIGKLTASLLLPLVLLASSIPVFVVVHLLGGVSLVQVACAIGISTAAGLAAGSWGSLVAFWRDKTFQTLAISLIGIVIFIGLVEGLCVLFAGDATSILWLGSLNPFRALLRVVESFGPLNRTAPETVALVSSLELLGVAAALIVATIWQVRIWNPSRTLGEAATKDEKFAGVVRPPRPVWESPVIWREMMTKAYGRKVIFIKLVYLVVAAFAIYSVLSAPAGDSLVLGMISPGGAAFVGLSLLTMMLVNAQAVTSLTTERDAGTLELLLVTDVSAREFIIRDAGIAVGHGCVGS